MSTDYENCMFCNHPHFGARIRMQTAGKLHPPIFSPVFEPCDECDCEYGRDG